MRDPAQLRKLADWYRDFAERAANPTIWEARLLTADALDQETDRIELLLASSDRRDSPGQEGSVVILFDDE